MVSAVPLSGVTPLGSKNKAAEDVQQMMHYPFLLTADTSATSC